MYCYSVLVEKTKGSHLILCKMMAKNIFLKFEDFCFMFYVLSTLSLDLRIVEFQ